jgi:membrane-associated protein
LGSIVDRVLVLNGLAIYLVVGAFVLAEDAIFVGFFVPGETVAILGGVAASRGHANVVWLCVIVSAAAIVGDNIGYAIGARYGDRVLMASVLRKRERRIRDAEALLRRRGGPAVIVGRFVAFLRAVMPFLAGMSHMRYGKFLAYNVVGGIGWGVGSVLLGFALADSYKAIERVSGPVTAGAFAVLVVAALIWWDVRRRRRARRADKEAARTSAR